MKRRHPVPTMRCAAVVLCSLLFVSAASALTDAELEAMRAEIARNGYSYTVGHTWVSDLPPEAREGMRGRHRGILPAQVSDDIGPLVERLGAALPASFDWRDRNGRSYIGPVRNQGSCGSCYAFGAAAAAEGAYNFVNGLYDASCANFSEAFIAWCLGGLPKYNPDFYGCEGGSFAYMELEALTQEGICFESVFPYSETDPQSCPAGAWGDSKAVFASWNRVPCGDVDAIKTAIMTFGVVDAGVLSASPGFDSYIGGVFTDANTTCDGTPCEYTDTDHAVSLVGWNDAGDADNNGYWILRNSWGADWGESGYMKIRYHAARVACEVAYLVYTGGPIVDQAQIDLNGTAFGAGSPFTATFRLNRSIEQPFTAYAVVVMPDGSMLDALTLGPDLAPVAENVPGLGAGFTYPLLNLTVPEGVPTGSYQVMAGFFTPGQPVTGPQDAFLLATGPFTVQ